MSGLITLNDLKTKFRSAGQYTVIVDNSITPNQTSVGIIRLVAGFSKAGNWNAPFFIDKGNTELAKNLYGNIDKSLERSKSFFQRTILNSLEEGDVLALNLLKTNNTVDIDGNPTLDADVVNYISMSLDPNESNGAKTSKLYASFYNKERFWSASPEYLLATRKVTDKGKLLNFVNLGQRKISVIVRKTNSKALSVKARDWYGSSEDVPKYVDPNVSMKEYFIDVFFVSGDFTNYASLKNDPVYSEYFNSDGLLADKFDSFLNAKGVNVINMYTGSILPNVKDANGVDMSIDNYINKQTSLTGMLCSIDHSEYDNIENGASQRVVDLLGSTLVDSRPDVVDFLSYKGAMNENAVYDKLVGAYELIDSTAIVVSDSPKKVVMTIPSTHPSFANITAKVSIGTAIIASVTTDGVDYGGLITGKSELYATRIQKSLTSVVIEFTSDEKKLENPNSQPYIELFKDSASKYSFDFLRNGIDVGTDTKGYRADINNQLYKDWSAGRIKDADEIKNSSRTFYVKFEEKKDDLSITGSVLKYGRKMLSVKLYDDKNLTQISTIVAPSMGSTFNSQGTPITTTSICLISPSNKIQENFECTPYTENSVYFDENADDEISRFNSYKVGDSIVCIKDNEKVLGEVTRVYKDIINGDSAILIEASEPIFLENGTSFYMQKSIQDMFASYNVHCLEGFTVKDTHMPNNTNARMREIYGVMTDTNIRKALIDPEFVNWRYFIDTFNHGIEPESKRYLTRMFRDRQKCLGILNAPSVAELIKSEDPRFTNSPTPSNPLPEFDTKHLLTGGNLLERPKFTMSLPKDADGVGFAGWFFPNVILIEDNEEKSIPPASYVGNAFMRKWIGGGYGEAVAGGVRGVLTGGLDRAEIPLDKEDRGDIKQFGMNPIYKRNGQVMIYGNNTGLTEFTSIRQHLHAKDILITLEIDIEKILESFEFVRGVFTDETTRTIIETSLNNYLENQRDSQSNIASFTLQIDRVNNPDWVVSNGSLILDLGVTLPEVTDTFITRITLNRAGSGVTVGSFTSV